MEANTPIISLNNCIGKAVLDITGNKCGTIKNFLVNPDHNVVPFVLISEGGFLGTGIDAEYMIAPMLELRFDNPDAAQYGLKISQDKLKNAPKYPKSGLKDKDSELLQEICDYYGLKMEAIRPGKIYEDGYQHESYEGSSQITGNIPADNQKISEEVDYNKIKGTHK